MSRVLCCGVVICLLLTVRAWGGESPAMKWVVSKTHVVRGPDGEFQVRLFQRFIATDRGPFLATNITYYHFPKKNMSIAEIMNSIIAGIGDKKWQRRAVGKAQVYGLHYRPNNRYIQIFLKNSGQAMEMSIALMRTMYLRDVALESEVIQRRLIGLLTGKTRDRRRVSNLKSGLRILAGLLWIPSAHAQTTPCGPLDFACVISNAGDKVDSINNVLDKGVGELDKLNKGVTTFNDQFSDLMDLINKQGSTFNNSFKKFNKELNRSNDIAERFLNTIFNPGVIFATSAAAGLGGLAVSLAVDGIIAGAKKVIDLITGESKKREILARFNEARENWEKTKEAKFKSERLLEQLIAVSEFPKKFNLSRENLMNIDAIIPRLESEWRVRKEILNDIIKRKLTGDKSVHQSCLNLLAFNVGEMEKLVPNLKLVQKIFSKKAPELKNNQRYCSNMQTILDRVKRTEQQLEVYRNDILNGDAQLMIQEA